jgi:hypothetical protein
MSKSKFLTGGRRAGHARGFCYDTDPTLADETAAQYEVRRLRLRDAWRPQNAQPRSERAWQDRKERHASRRRSRTAQRQTMSPCSSSIGDASR